MQIQRELIQQHCFPRSHRYGSTKSPAMTQLRCRLHAIAPPRETEYLGLPRQEREDGGPAWTLSEYQKLFRNYQVEEDYSITDIDGSVPTDIEGTFYRNGPGIMELGGEKMHAFDGHGLIVKVAVKDGKATFKSRYIQTEVYKKEVEANKIMYRGFGSQKPGGMLANFLDIADKPVANTSVMEWNGKLYALWEADNPHILDPDSLETLGLENFGGVLRNAQPFTAHPCYDKENDRLVAFSNGIRHGEGKLHIWELDRSGKIQQAITHKTGMLPVLYLHDFQITKNWYIFHQAPLQLVTANLFRYFAGLCDSTQQISFDSTTSGKWWLCPRKGGEPLIIESEPSMIWHYGNAFEDEETGKVTVDACTMSEFDFSTFDMREPTTIPGGEVKRHTLDPRAKTAVSRTIMPGLGAGDFPQTNPKFQMDSSYRYLYIAGTADESETYPFRRVVKLNMQTGSRDSWLAPDGCFVSEPIYVPRKGAKPDADEDDGYITCLISNGRQNRSQLAFFEAKRISEGPICQLNMSNLIPIAFHCFWTEKAFI